MKTKIMAHMVAGFPDAARSLEVARGLIAGGAAYIEVQFPFSDPTADGPDIQAACGEALRRGFTVWEGFRLLAEICALSPVPVFLMSYANLLIARGIESFLRACQKSGAVGVIVPDLPPGSDEGLYGIAARMGMHAMPVLSPSMRRERLSRIPELGARYLYATLRSGTTGQRTTIDAQSLSFLAAINALPTQEPTLLMAGFGITTRDQVIALEPHVHAIIVGSALVREVARGGDVETRAREKVRGLLAAET